MQFDAQEVAADGRRVVVERAVLPEGGFVAIHEGEPSGPILGVSDPLPAGTSRHVAVTLAEESRIVGRSELSAVLYRDEDGDGTFDLLRAEFGDDPYRVDGRPVHDTAVVFGPTPTETVPPPPTPTPSASPSPTASPTATGTDGAIPGFGFVAAVVAAGAGAVAARLRG